MNTISTVSSSKLGHFVARNFVRLVLGSSLALFSAGQGFAQYGGGGGGTGTGTYTAPPGGYSSAAKGAGVGVLFLAMHYHARVTGCVQPGDDGLRLRDEKEQQNLCPGSR